MKKRKLLTVLCLCAMVSFSGTAFAQDVDVPDVSNKIYDGGSVTGNGGAILNTIESTIKNSTFNKNSAQSGGAINNTGTLKIVDTIFDGNEAKKYGGAINNYGLDVMSGALAYFE